MIAVLQRVKQGSVTVNGELIGEIKQGLVILLGVTKNDTDEDCIFLVEKSATMRIFSDDAGKMNLSLLQVGGSALVISQFTLAGDWRKGRRPSFSRAAAPDEGKRLYNLFIESLKAQSVPVRTGEFGAMMDVSLVNDGPVTFVLDSKER